ncbi:MAG: hypothetical protein QG670_121 [Thermoproteota archaeon]|nr:hypothetical protein [Thermoproteota archaeon]
MSEESETIYTIGHSTRPLTDFVKILKSYSITLLCDVRSITKSRHNPQFNGDSLEIDLKKDGISYLHLEGLGGFRRANKNSANSAWTNTSFRGFTDYMQTERFETSLEQLIALGSKEKVVIMCAEANPFRCHRLLIADALISRRIRVFHISSKTSKREHVITGFAKVVHEKVTYPG